MLVFFTNKINKCNKNIYLISEAQKVHYKMSFMRVSEPIVGKLVHEMKYYCQSSFTTPTAWSVLSILCGLTIPVAIGKAQQRAGHPCSPVLVLRIPGPDCLRFCGTHFGGKNST